MAENGPYTSPAEANAIAQNVYTAREPDTLNKAASNAVATIRYAVSPSSPGPASGAFGTYPAKESGIYANFGNVPVDLSKGAANIIYGTDGTFAVQYINIDTTAYAKNTDFIPVQNIVNQLNQLISSFSDNPFEWTDNNGWKVLQILGDGTLQGLTALFNTITGSQIFTPILQLGGALQLNNDPFGDYYITYEDAAGNILFGIDKNAKLRGVSIDLPTTITLDTATINTLTASNGSIDRLSTNEITVDASFKVVNERNDVYLEKYEDANGNIAYGTLLKDGSIIMRGCKIESNNIIPNRRPFGTLAQVNHIIVYGQSLAVGATGSPPFTTQSKYNNIGFTDTTTPRWNGSSTFNAFTPLNENNINNVETICSALGEMFIQAMQQENNLTLGDDYKLLIGTTGQGDRSIDQLSKTPIVPSTTPGEYQRNIQVVRGGMATANAAGMTYNVPAIVFIQGENDLKSPAGYYDKLLQIKFDLINDIKAITKQTNDPLFFISQLASQKAYGSYPFVPLAQLRASLQSNGIYLGATSYHTVYNSDNIHKTNDSYKKMGADFGYALKRSLIDGEEWLPLYVKRFTGQANIIELEYHIPKAPLTIDTTLVSDPGNYGFTLTDASGNTITLQSVNIIRGNTIRIIAAAGTVIAPGWKLTYGNPASATGSGPTTGCRGNIRDNSGATVVFNGSSGTNLSAYNYLVHRWAPIQEFNF